MGVLKQLRKEKNWDNFILKIQNLSDSRKRSIINSNSWFDDFCVKNYKKTKDEIIAYVKTLNIDDSEETITDLLQEWLNHLHSQKLVVPTIKVYLVDINSYLKYHKIRIDLKELEWPQQLKEEPYTISISEIHKIFNVAAWNKKLYYLSLISTGARPIEIIGLKKKDFQWNYETNTYTALIPAYLTKKKMARTVKFSREVTSYLIKRLKEIESDSLVYTKNKNIFNARTGEDITFLRYCRKVGLTEKYETTGRNKVNLYCFRGYFFTRVQRVLGDETAHALIGHGAYLQQYQRRTLEEKIELWNELESEVLVFDLEKKNHEIKKLKDANTKFAEQEEEIKKQNARILQLERAFLESKGLLEK